MNKWAKSFVFSVGVTLVMWMLMTVLSSPTTSQTEVVIPTNPNAGGFSQYNTAKQTFTEVQQRDMPNQGTVLSITFLGSFLIGITIFKTKEQPL